MALNPQAGVRAGIASYAERLAGDLRPVAAGSLHVTLVFLGWQEADDAPRIATAAEAAADGKRAAFLAPTGVRAVPPRSPRLLALELEDRGGRCASLQSSLAAVLFAEGLYQPEKRPFWPHLTLARVKRGGRAEASPASKADRLPAPFVADRVVLFRSILRPQGAVYEPLWTTTLEP